jgi:hypothetical protein
LEKRYPHETARNLVNNAVKRLLSLYFYAVNYNSLRVWMLAKTIKGAETTAYIKQKIAEAAQKVSILVLD